MQTSPTLPRLYLWLFATLQNVPVRLTIDVQQRLVISTFSGETNDAEILGHLSVIASHPDFDPSFSEIVDFSGITAGSMSTSMVQELSQRPSIFSLDSIHVIVAPQDFVFGLARMSQVFAEKTKPNLAVVRTIEEAHNFLKLEKTAPD
jgi:hypothetical protein